MKKPMQKTKGVQTPPAALAKILAASDGDIVEMSTDAFIGLEGFPGHRARISAADRAFWTDAGAARGERRRRLMHVVVAVVGDRVYKINGHKRAKLWTAGDFPRPKTIPATVYRCEDISSAKMIFQKYRTSGAVERADEEIKRGFAACGFTPLSYRLKHGKLAEPIYMAFRGGLWSEEDDRFLQPIDFVEAVGVIKDELVILDALEPPQRLFNSGLIAAAFIGLALEPSSEAFFGRLARREGSKRLGLCDPVESVLNLSAMSEEMDVAAKRRFQEDLFRRALRGLDAWLREQKTGEENWLKNKLQAADAAPWIERFRMAKGIEDRLDL